MGDAEAAFARSDDYGVAYGDYGDGYGGGCDDDVPSVRSNVVGGVRMH